MFTGHIHESGPVVASDQGCIAIRTPKAALTEKGKPERAECGAHRFACDRRAAMGVQEGL
jgi:hypothetical protein